MLRRWVWRDEERAPPRPLRDVLGDLGVSHAPLIGHLLWKHRPPAMALLNPLQPGCAFPFKGLSGAGVVFYLLMGLRAELRARGHEALPDLRRYLDLVALGTVADVVPLREENRVLVAHGLRVLDRPARPGLIALREAALVETTSARSVGFRLAPRLNAGGRLADARLAVEMLTTDDVVRARAVASELEMHNAERRAIEESMVHEAMDVIETSDPRQGTRTIVVARDARHPGVVGIVAARLAERFNRPALVVALEGDLGRGSGRSVRSVDPHGALAECGDMLATFGGHRQAVGFTVRRERVGELAARFEEAVHRTTTPADLEPHGAANPEPTLLARDVEVDGVRLVGDPARPHLKLRLRQDGRALPAIGFGLGRLPVDVGDRVDVVFTPRLARWQGAARLELDVIDLRTGSGLRPRQAVDNAGEFRVP